ncbi:MAG: hypothetical protein QOG62_755 [Thermoleophilaceae bacterium]|jgi:FkbM family methyltransferase|nr:hypothetical protein [Thermoleophilaceae bacterium]
MSAAARLGPGHLRYLIPRLRQALVLKPAWLFLLRELVLRRHGRARYRVRDTGLVVNIRHRSDDPGNVTEVLQEGAYRFAPAVAQALSGRGPLQAVDLGGYIGLFGVSLFSQHPDASLVALEPDPANADVLEQTIADNSLGDRWSVVRACASVREETVRFTPGRGMGSSVSETGETFPAVDVFPLLAGADLIKIDIEGAEWPILTDPRFVDLPAAALFLEYHPPHGKEEILRVLEAAGWRTLPFEERAPGLGELWAIRR